MSPRDDQPPAVVGLAAAACERTAVDPHHDRSRRSRHRRRPDVQAQAVLVALLAELRVGAGILDAARPRLGGIADPLPGLRRRGRPEAQRAHRRCRVRDTGEQPMIPLDFAANRAGWPSAPAGIRLWRGVGTTGDGGSRISGMAALGDAPTSRPSATTSTVAITTSRTTRRLRAVPGCTESEPTQAFSQNSGSRVWRSPRLRT